MQTTWLRTDRPSHGFTLVEVLVAMTIMSIIALMSWQGVDSIVRTRAISQTKLERLLRINSAMAQWEQDLGALQKSDLPDFSEPIKFDGSSVTMTRAADDGLQVVVWALRGGVLQRWAGPPVTTDRALQDQVSNSARFLGNEAGQLSMLTGISEWQLYFYINDAWANAQSTGGTRLATRLVLTMSGASGDTGQITRDSQVRPY